MIPRTPIDAHYEAELASRAEFAKHGVICPQCGADFCEIDGHYYDAGICDYGKNG